MFAPLAIGGTSTPALCDSPDLTDLGGATRLELKTMKPVGEGSVWLHYNVKNSGNSQEPALPRETR